MFGNFISNAAMLLVQLGSIEALLPLDSSLPASLRYSVLLALERGRVSFHPIILSSISSPLVLSETRSNVPPPTRLACLKQLQDLTVLQKKKSFVLFAELFFRS
ncbi:uncharacterized [Tachysurus ichikawai]